MTVKTFDSIEDLFAFQEKNRKSADSYVKVVQRKMGIGDCFLRYVPDADLIIYGELIDPLGYFEGKDLDAGDGELREEYEYEKAARAEPHMKNYRFANCYSVMCREGEVGDVHVSVMQPILRGVFDFAQKKGWPSSGDTGDSYLDRLISDARSGTGFWAEVPGGRA